MNLIACVDKNWAIGNKGELLVSIPSDKKLFKELTDGKVVIGGRKTMEAIPGGTTLGGRTNIILTSDKKYTYGNAVIVHSIDEALEEIEQKVELIRDEQERKSSDMQNYVATVIAVFGLISIVASVLSIVDLVNSGSTDIVAALGVSCIGVVLSWLILMLKK